MWWDTEDKEEDRSHQDNEKQYCDNYFLRRIF